MSANNTGAAAAPWRARFLELVQGRMDSPEFVLSTLHPAPKGAPTTHVPSARYCVYRGLWAELPENKHNEAPKNERVYESDLPTFTTDVRMEKIPDVFASSAGQADRSELWQGSGGGGPVEAVWWVKDAMIQWRVKGHAFIVAPDIEGDGEESSGVRTVKSEITKRMRIVKPGHEANWSWQTELTAHFGNLSPMMRGSFKQPPPGKPVSEPYNSKEEKMGEKVEDLHDQVSRRNFRVVIIRPEEVEELDLSNPGKSKRLKYTYVLERDGWDVVETWP